MATHNRYNFLIIFFVALGSFTYGFNSAIVGAIIGLNSFLAYFNLDIHGPDAKQANSLIGAINGLFATGGFIGCWLVPQLLNIAGRRRAIQASAALCILSAALQAGSMHIAMLLVGRFLNGVGIGMMDVAVPIYQSEISPAKVRGRMVGTHGFLVVCGYGMAGWVGLACYFITNPALQWRLCLAVQVVAPLMLLAGSPWMTESPRWLCTKDRSSAAFEVLKKLHHTPEDTEDTLAQHELQQILAQLQFEREHTGPIGWKVAFTKKSFRTRMFYGFFVQCIAQSTGVLVVNNYQILLYNNLGLHNWTPLLLYACYNSWAAFMNWVNAMMLDRWGRIRIMLTGLIGCSLSLSGFAAMVAQFAGSPNKLGNGFGVFFLYLFVTFYGGSLDASSYVYCAEIFPTSIRAQGVGFSVSGLFIMTLLYTQVAPTAFAAVGWRYLLVFILVPWAGAFVMHRYLPETAGRTLEEIDILFGDEDTTAAVRAAEEKLAGDSSRGGVSIPSKSRSASSVNGIDSEHRETSS